MADTNHRAEKLGKHLLEYTQTKPETFYTLGIYHLQTTGNQRYRENPERSQRENKQLTNRETKVRITCDSALETMQARRGQNETFKEVRRNVNQPRFMYLANLSFKSEGEIKTF